MTERSPSTHSASQSPQLPLTTLDACARCHRPIPHPRAVPLEGNIVMGCRACNPNVPTPPAISVGIEACQNTLGAPATDNWPGCLD